MMMGYECLRKKEVCSITIFFLSFFSVSLFYLSRLPNRSAYRRFSFFFSFSNSQLINRTRELARAAFERLYSIKSVTTPRRFTSLSDLQQCPKNTAILSQIPFGFCRLLHDYPFFFFTNEIVRLNIYTRLPSSPCVPNNYRSFLTDCSIKKKKRNKKTKTKIKEKKEKEN